MLLLERETKRRNSAIRQLLWSDINFKEETIRWRRETDKVRREGVTPLTEAALDVLRALPRGVGTVPVFAGKDGRVMGGGMIQRGPFARLQKKCGVVDGEGKARYRFDDLRHAAAALCIEHGWPARKLRDMLGEASVAAVARRYAPLFERAGDDRVALELIAARLLPTP